MNYPISIEDLGLLKKMLITDLSMNQYTIVKVQSGET